jgi:hypothetical protein
MARRPLVTLAAIVLSFTLFAYFISTPQDEHNNISLKAASQTAHGTMVDDILSAKDPVTMELGSPIMSKMTNETIRAELGRSAWKVFHTILAQYPEQPTSEERDTLKNYIYLFSRVYPCRECAEHFQALLKQFPPQLSSREVASQWGCHVHNQVNAKLGKEEFDCLEISDKYACGCSEDEEDNKKEINITMERQDPETGG